MDQLMSEWKNAEADGWVNEWMDEIIRKWKNLIGG